MSVKWTVPELIKDIIFESKLIIFDLIYLLRLVLNLFFCIMLYAETKFYFKERRLNTFNWYFGFTLTKPSLMISTFSRVVKISMDLDIVQF